MEEVTIQSLSKLLLMMENRVAKRLPFTPYILAATRLTRLPWKPMGLKSKAGI
jgi:hypothetical protein